MSCWCPVGALLVEGKGFVECFWEVLDGDFHFFHLWCGEHESGLRRFVQGEGIWKAL